MPDAAPPSSPDAEAAACVPAAPPAKTTDETIKETFESIIIAFALAFIFRAFIVEAFVIPTGSMAPTLLGQHLRFTCEQCGFDYDTDASDRTEVGDGTITTTCPMCFWPNHAPPGTLAGSGDRILVQKYAYSFTEPRRWDVVVFKNPRYRISSGSSAPGPRQNYIKRLVGLPGEQVAILEGNLYVARDGEPFEIARKVDAQANPRWRDIQNTVWQPIYHSQYIPLDGGDGGRERRGRPWACPWVPDAGRWDTEDRRGYTLLEPDDQGRGRLRFRFEPPDAGRFGHGTAATRYPYNQTSDTFPSSRYAQRINNPRLTPWDAIEDIRLAVNARLPDAEAAIRLTTTARRAGEPEPLAAQITATGTAELRWGGDLIAGPIDIHGIKPGRTTRIELWHVDQAVLLWVGGKLVVDYRLDLSWDQVIRRPPIARVPDVAIEVTGASATLYQVHLDRDLFYGARDQHSGAAHGGFVRGGPERIASGTPMDLAENEFFVIGDNGPISDDARFWGQLTGQQPDIYPWVEALMFADDGRDHTGRVPRRLLVGRAFFVYYPAPFGLSPEAPGVFPNFGRMRLIY